MNEGSENTRHGTDWKAILQAAGLFWVIVGAVLGFYGNHLLGLVDDRIAKHASSARDNRDAFYRDIQQRADNAASRIGTDISELKSNCAVMQNWATGVESEIAELNRWRSECGQKMAKVQQYMERDTADIRDLEREVRELQNLEINEHKGSKR